MTDVKISELPVADAAHADDLLEASQVVAPGHLSKSITLDQVTSLVAGSDQVQDQIDAAIGAIPAGPTTLPPSGAAGGDLAGSYPNPTIKPSVALTGNPTAPTPLTADNDTSIATTAFTRAAIANFAPAPDLSAYALIASPTFTGDPKAPTPTTADNDTSIATTAYVKANIAAIPAPPPSTYVGIAPPGTPTDGQLWFNSDAAIGGGQLYIRYNDATGAPQWVPAAAAASLTTPGGDFCANQTSAFQSIPNGAYTTSILTQILSGNSGGWYSTSTGRFTPPAGRYEVYGSWSSSSTVGSTIRLVFRKNGVVFQENLSSVSQAGYFAEVEGSATVDANGSDWFDMQLWNGAGTSTSYAVIFQAFPISGVKGPPGDPGVGLLQTVAFETGAVATGTTVIPFDDTIPQITEGDQYMTCVVTPRSATSRLIIEVVIILATTGATGNVLTAIICQDATANALAAASLPVTATIPTAISLRHIMTSGTTSATTFRVRAGCNVAGTTTFNGQGGNRIYGGVIASSIVIQEVQ